jgi:hypothetical protein
LISSSSVVVSTEHCLYGESIRNTNHGVQPTSHAMKSHFLQQTRCNIAKE